ncbi:MAG TPA: DUF1349 domain-containing protein [Cyclobacteriaceae bacterium]|nr:DUF1349 domain-containing protein [Cyclobacteriaceae bacterium]
MKRTFFFIIILFFGTRLSAQEQTTKLASIPYALTWENIPEKYSIEGNTLTIIAGEKTDMFHDPNVAYNTDNAPKLLFHADHNFILIASIEHSFLNKWDGGALVIKSDSLNWIKFCFEKDYTGAKRVVSVVTKNISDDCNSMEISTNKVFYKIAKADNVITLYYSQDGAKWFLIRHVRFDVKPGFQVGFLAQSPTGTQCEVIFSDIRYEARKIKDPYAGE